jgi:hypothetical protein
VPRITPPAAPATRSNPAMITTTLCSSTSDGVGPDGVGIKPKMARMSDRPSKKGVPNIPDNAPAMAA